MSAPVPYGASGPHLPKTANYIYSSGQQKGSGLCRYFRARFIRPCGK